MIDVVVVGGLTRTAIGRSTDSMQAAQEEKEYPQMSIRYRKAPAGVDEGSLQRGSAIVLTSPGFSVIVQAIVFAWNIFQRVQKCVNKRLECTLQFWAFFPSVTMCVDLRKVMESEGSETSSLDDQDDVVWPCCLRSRGGWQGS